MARPIEEFALAWDSLSEGFEGEGWRSIAVKSAGSCALMAARRFPGNAEALLAEFSSVRVPPAETLPEGFGFQVSRADPHGDGKVWLALTRKESGSIELFAEMVCDVAGALDAVSTAGDERILQTFLSRVRSWQEFMRKDGMALSPESEIGLIGELFFLDSILNLGVPAQMAVDAWLGPLGGIQDFELEAGAVEIKATLSSSGFPAKIGSLEQLDDSVRRPLFLAGARLVLRESGKTLSEIAGALKEKLVREIGAQSTFIDKLLAAGYRDAHIDRYKRRFLLVEMRVLEVVEGFPRLIPGSVPGGIRAASYEIDFDRAPGADVGVTGALNKLGLI